MKRLRLGRVRAESSWSDDARAAFIDQWDAGDWLNVAPERLAEVANAAVGAV